MNWENKISIFIIVFGFCTFSAIAQNQLSENNIGGVADTDSTAFAGEVKEKHNTILNYWTV